MSVRPQHRPQAPAHRPSRQTCPTPPGHHDPYRPGQSPPRDLEPSPGPGRAAPPRRQPSRRGGFRPGSSPAAGGVEVEQDAAGPGCAICSSVYQGVGAATWLRGRRPAPPMSRTQHGLPRRWCRSTPSAPTSTPGAAAAGAGRPASARGRAAVRRHPYRRPRRRRHRPRRHPQIARRRRNMPRVTTLNCGAAIAQRGDRREQEVGVVDEARRSGARRAGELVGSPDVRHDELSEE